MTQLKWFLLVFCLIYQVRGHREKRFIVYPAGTYMGLLYALAIPLDKDHKNVMLSVNFEANYYFEQVPTRLEYLAINSAAPKSFQSMNRKLVYHVIESKMESNGYSGRNCLLRAICEATESELDHSGVLGQILSVILTPSTSKSENLTSDFHLAEINGHNHNCSDYHKACDISFLDAISIIF